MSVTTVPGRIAGWTAPAAAIPLAAGLAFAALTLFLIWAKAYPSDFDELEHVSYAAYLQETHEWRPMFEAMRDLPRNSLASWDSRTNYLGHPAPFYWLEALFLDRTLPLGDAVVRLRLVSAGLVAGGVGLTLLAGLGHFRRDRLALGLFCTLVALNPKMLAVAGQVTNDALALLAGGLAYWGASAGVRRRAGLLACGLALVLALWAKPNAGFAVGAVLGLHALLRWREGVALVGALGAAALVGSVPYWLILAKYGVLVPVTVEQFGGVRQVPGAAFLPVFLFNLAYTFCYHQTGAWPVPGGTELLVSVLVWALLGTAAYGGWRAWQAPGGTVRRLAITGPAAMLAVMPVHLWFTLTALGGSIPAASFRYYLPIWPFLAHAVAYAVAGGGARTRRSVLGLVGAALLVGWLSP